jgi:hypothetical protein
MKKTFALIPLALFIFSCISSGQESKKRINECNCKVAFNDMINKLESNYIGLKQMQISSKDEGFEDRKRVFEQKSVDILPEDCTEFLNEFLDYFHDGHLSVFERPIHTGSDLLKYEKSIKDTKLDKSRLKQRLLFESETANSEEKDVILGNWTDGESEFIVFEVENDYHAYILETKKEGVEAGELKAIFRPKTKGYSCTYYSYNYSPIYIRGDVYKDGQLLVAGHIIWKKIEAPFSVTTSDINNLKLPTIEIINESSALLTIPSFVVDYQAFNDFLKNNGRLIRNSTHLIIDIRGNRGGNGVYFTLIEMFATQNMDGGQGLVLASKDNLAYFERQMKYSKKVYKPVVKRIKGNYEKILDGPLYPGKKFKIRESKIKNVAILTDNACASAAESFIIHSKRASSKVKTFGSSTAGMIDYTSVNSLLLNSGKQNIYFGYPTSTLHKEIPDNGYNVTGIIPDVPIKEYVKDKIDYIVNYYRE